MLVMILPPVFNPATNTPALQNYPPQPIRVAIMAASPALLPSREGADYSKPPQYGGFMSTAGERVIQRKVRPRARFAGAYPRALVVAHYPQGSIRKNGRQLSSCAEVCGILPQPPPFFYRRDIIYHYYTSKYGSEILGNRF